MTDYAPGHVMVFPRTGGVCLILAVDHHAGTVTFCDPDIRDDQATETITDLDAVDVRVLPLTLALEDSDDRLV